MSPLLAVPVILTFLVNVGSQDKLQLDEPITGELRITHPGSLSPCDFGVVIGQIARATRLTVGFENRPECWLSSRADAAENTLVFTGLSLRKAFDLLLTYMPAFSWKEVGGVIVFRPTAAWDDPRDVLNLPTKAFIANDEKFEDVLDRVLQSVTPSLFLGRNQIPVTERQELGRIAVQFGGGTLLEAVNVLAGSRTNVDWQLGYGSGRATLVFTTPELRGAVAMAPVAVPTGRQ